VLLTRVRWEKISSQLILTGGVHRNLSRDLCQGGSLAAQGEGDDGGEGKNQRHL